MYIMKFHYPFFFHEQHSLQDMFYWCSVPRQHYLCFLTNKGSPQRNKSQGCEKFFSKARLKAPLKANSLTFMKVPLASSRSYHVSWAGPKLVTDCHERPLGAHHNSLLARLLSSCPCQASGLYKQKS